ncbi:MAG: ABC transporter ATP-binding protein [Spirochaetaceae bacterium]|jgi:putative spermidine/putrescine transport system ATP-binding protein|nr:ABC transporter ATP-binding protein [Spirochaetaceae bacterium]
MLEVKHIQKSFGNFAVQADFTVADGKILVLMGSSGSGKTTILNMIAGFIEPDSGDIILNGRNLQAIPPWKRHCGYVFQENTLFPHLNVWKNVAYGLKIKDKQATQADKKALAETYLEKACLKGFAERRVTELSGGEAQRVAIARALASEPDILLFDEPFSGLDTALKESLRKDFREIIRGKNAVFVTHDKNDADALADTVLNL